MPKFNPPPPMKLDSDYVYIPLYKAGFLKIHKSHIDKLGGELVETP